VDDLLRAHREAGNFLGGVSAADGTIEHTPIAERAGTIIGPYKLLQQIGDGGMGVVFMAEQTEPIQRTVALKIIKPGMDTRQVIARFEAERQALAMMDHQNIAKVLDAGTTETGRPFFVMDLVKGVPITRYCDEKHLSLRERLDLFIQVCRAVQHAHQKGIIHRDIKPTNVIVAEYDNHAVPKVIDFGVAKATAQKLTERTMFTEFGQVVGTIEYMSPEQAKLNQLDIDTRSDIYSLGVLLYELLTGTTPFERKRLQEAAFDEMLRIIREEEPLTPSTRLSSLSHAGEGRSEGALTLASIAANRHTEPARLSKELRGELDWIVMKALDKDRNRRYESATGLARDIERHLHDEPVQASPPSAGYRFNKFARRNKATLIAASLVAAVLILGLIGTTWQALRATRAERLSQSRLKAETEARKQADEAFKQSRSNYKLAEEQRKAAENQRRRAEENVKLAIAVLDEIILKPAVQRLSINKIEHERLLPKDATRELQEREVLQKAAQFYEQFAQRNSTNPSAQFETAKADRSLAWLHMNRGERDKGAASFQNAVDILERLTAQFPEEADFGLELAHTYRWLAWPYRDSGSFDTAEELTRRALSILAKLGRQFPAHLRRFQSEMLWCHKDLGVILSLAGRVGEAEQAYRDALAIAEELPPAPPQSETYRWDLFQEADTRSYLGDLLKQAGRTPETIQVWQESLPLWEKLAAASNEPSHRWILATRLDSLGDLLSECNRVQEAEECYSKALPVWQKLVGDFNLPDYRRNLAYNRERLGRLLMEVNRLQEAQSAYREALAGFGKLVAEFNVPDHRTHLSWNYTSLAEVLRRRAQQAEQDSNISEADRKTTAAAYRDEARQLLQDRVKLGLHTPQSLNGLAWQVVRTPNPHGRDAAWAVDLAKETVELSPETGTYWNTLGVAHYWAGDWKAALTALRKSMDMRNGGDAYDWFFLAMAHWQLGQKEEARKWYHKAAEWMDKNHSKNEELRRFRSEAAELLGIAEPQPQQSTEPESTPDAASNHIDSPDAASPAADNGKRTTNH
jgi:serine/threonine protein kinase